MYTCVTCVTPRCQAATPGRPLTLTRNIPMLCILTPFTLRADPPTVALTLLALGRLGYRDDPSLVERLLEVRR